MSRIALFIALAALASGCMPALAQDAELRRTPLTDKAWVRAEESALPGRMQIFLSNGTLVSDSCWETYRLSAWRWDGEQALAWEEDGMPIAADILELTETSLRLKLRVADEEEQRFVPAAVPWVCPDMPR